MVEEFRACYNLVYNLISRYGDVGRCRNIQINLERICESSSFLASSQTRVSIAHKYLIASREVDLGEGGGGGEGGVKLPLRLFFHRAASVKK